MPIHVRIVTRRAVAWEGVARAVQAPGFTGEFGVLPEHEQYITLVRPGRVLIQSTDGDLGFIVGVGFAEAGPDHLTLLTDHCEPLKDVDRDKALADLKQAEEALVHLADGTPEWEMAERKVWLARARAGV